jgi:CBS domain containing-hemolysin-like protein
MIIELLALVICFLLNAFFSAAEIAVVSITKTRVEQLVKGKHRGSESLLKLKNDSKKLFSTTQLGITFVSMGASALVAVFTVQFFGSYLVAAATAVLAFLVVIFGEVVPKNFAYVHAENIALSSAKPINFLATIFMPFVWLVDVITKVVLRGKERPKQSITSEELKAYLAMGAEGGAVGKREKEMIENVLNLKEVTAGDVMTPRVLIFGFKSALTVKDVIKDISSFPYSRVPVYGKTNDDIIGVIHIKSILKCIESNELGKQLKDLIEKPFFVPETILLADLLKFFQEKKTHIAIVVDEFGGVQGLVTLTDLIEEIVGELVTESDVTKNIMMRVDKYTIIVDGATQAGNINRFFNIILPGKSFETISRLILKKLKSIPKEGDELNIGDLNIKIEKVEGNRIIRVKLTKPEKPVNP